MPSALSTDRRFSCLCGTCHVVTGTQVSLVLYVLFSIFSVVFGMKCTLTWLLVPVVVVGLACYAFATHRHKYLYPFLIITVVQHFVCLVMAFIILVFALVNLESMRQIIGHALETTEKPSAAVALLTVSLTIVFCLLVALLHIWQAILIYRCLEYYEELSGGDCFDRRRIVLSSSRWDPETAADSTSLKDYRGGML